MKQFMDKDFMLENPTAIELYNAYAKDAPILDYHCHMASDENKRRTGGVHHRRQAGS